MRLSDSAGAAAAAASVLVAPVPLQRSVGCLSAEDTAALQALYPEGDPAAPTCVVPAQTVWAFRIFASVVPPIIISVLFMLAATKWAQWRDSKHLKSVVTNLNQVMDDERGLKAPRKTGAGGAYANRSWASRLTGGGPKKQSIDGIHGLGQHLKQEGKRQKRRASIEAQAASADLARARWARAMRHVLIKEQSRRRSVARRASCDPNAAARRRRRRRRWGHDRPGVKATLSADTVAGCASGRGATTNRASDHKLHSLDELLGMFVPAASTAWAQSGVLPSVRQRLAAVAETLKPMRKNLAAVRQLLDVQQKRKLTRTSSSTSRSFSAPSSTSNSSTPPPPCWTSSSTPTTRARRSSASYWRTWRPSIPSGLRQR